MKTLIVILIVFLFFPSYTLAINTNPPNDKYWHGGGMMVCAYTMKKIIKRSTSPRLISFLFCNFLGAIKEYGLDVKADISDMKANMVGAFIGIYLEFN